MSPNGPGSRPVVLHVSEAYGGGVQAAIQQYAKNSPGLRHHIMFRSRVSHDISEASTVEMTAYEGSVWGFLLEARRLIASMRPEVIHLHSSFAGLLRAFRLGLDAKLIYTPHAYAFLREDCSPAARAGFRLVEKRLSRRPQTIAAISPYEAAQAARMAGRQTAIEYLPNTVGEPAAACECEQFVRGQPEVVMAGRISPQKDPYFYANVARESKRQIRWIWVGDGDAEALGVMRDAGITVTGWLPNAHVKKHIGNADLYLHTARWEGAPITLLEAASMGTPILVRSVDSLIGLGYSFAGDTPQDVARAVDRFFADERYRTEISAVTKTSSKVHSTRVQVAALRSLYGGIR